MLLIYYDNACSRAVVWSLLNVPFVKGKVRLFAKFLNAIFLINCFCLLALFYIWCTRESSFMVYGFNVANLIVPIACVLKFVDSMSIVAKEYINTRISIFLA
ncbi:hypothetical protein FIV04_26065 (plasmid) [Vibrio sp. THAF190c]|nr:hypothetical protein FIV04_26065 [Vibrio sp. THAF190c]